MWIAVAVALVSVAVAGVAPPVWADALDRMEAPPAAWRGTVFKGRFDFPASPRSDALPWQTVSFRKEPKRYLELLLAYALAGQDREHWHLQANKVRRWYHVPWLGPGATGREFIHGLTRGRDLAPGDLGPGQTACRQTWALAFYNDAGGAVLGRIWRPVARGTGGPDLSALPFPSGTVAVKLIFTEATAADDPRLAGAPELLADIHADATPDDAMCAAATDKAGRPAARAPRDLRLLQFDIAVREERASYKTGWVFGSFVFDGRRGGSDPWAKLVPLGLMWGNDPGLSDAEAEAGAQPRQSIVFPSAKGFGRGGRMNGIADERGSGCSSCHMAAQWPTVAAMKAPDDWAAARCWFRNLDARYPFGFPPGVKGGCSDPSALAKVRPLDFSLQLAIALRNWSLEKAKAGKPVQSTIGTLVRSGDSLTVDGLTAMPLKR
jgi:hypothetical protein